MTHILSPTDRVLDALRAHGHEPKRSGNGWMCRCPAHDDRSPSLSIGTGADGRALVKCHAGCETADVLAAVGLSMRDLMPDDDGHRSNGDAVPKTPVPKTDTGDPVSGGIGDGDTGDTSETRYPTAREAVAALERRHGQRSGAWTYRDATGEPVGMVIRWDNPDGSKRILPVSRNGSGWALRGMPTPRPLYGLRELAESNVADPVYVSEGEKAADAIRACGLLATTSPHGSKSAAKADWTPLKGRDVVVLPDHDNAGEAYAADVAQLAQEAGAKSVRIVRLADRWEGLSPGGDVVDALELEGGDADAVRAGIEASVGEADAEHGQPGAAPAQFTPFPVNVLPRPVAIYIKEAAAAIGCDPSYVALPMLAGLAGAIGNTRRIQLKKAWTEPAILWCVIVGESGTAKSPAMELALRAVKARQDRCRKAFLDDVKAYEADHARWEIEQAAWKKASGKGDADDQPLAPDKPTLPRTWTDDVTPEALVSLLTENPRGLLMIRDELAGWFSFDRYAGGKGGSDTAKWLDVFSGRALTVDRKTSGTEYVPQASVSIAGGIQPETLRRALGQEHRDSGLAARLLFAMPPRKPKAWTDDDVSDRTVAELARLFDRLYALEPDTDVEGDPQPRLLTLDPDAKQAFINFVNEHGAEQADRTGDEAAAWSKLEGYGARLALVVHLTRSAVGDPSVTDPDIVDEASIVAGVTLVRWFANEAERVYALLAGDDDTREQTRLLEWIEGRGGCITPPQLSKGMRCFRGNAAEARDALDELVQAGLGRWEYPPPGPNGGRPAEVFVALSANTESS